MNLITLIQHLPLAVIVSFLAGNVIPYLSALVTRFPGWWTGMVTVTLSVASGFLSEWVAAGDGFNWQAALGAAFGTWIVAAFHHWKILSGTTVEAAIHAFPPKPVTQPATKQAA